MDGSTEEGAGAEGDEDGERTVEMNGFLSVSYKFRRFKCANCNAIPKTLSKECSRQSICRLQSLMS
jgi:hypothetical protein